MYLEFDADGASSSFRNPVAFADGCLAVPRDYRLFQALAGLSRVGDRTPSPLFLPRGLPVTYSHAVAKDFYQPVRYPGENLWGPDESVSLEEATRWVAEGKSTFADSLHKRNGLVSVPDWHSASWLLEREVTAALRQVRHAEPDLSVEFRAVLHLMRFFESQLGADRTRLVFWFDN